MKDKIRAVLVKHSTGNDIVHITNDLIEDITKNVDPYYWCQHFSFDSAFPGDYASDDNFFGSHVNTNNWKVSSLA